MYFDLATQPKGNAYKLLTGVVVPRPIAWVVSQDADGRLNAAPFSFFNAFSGEPPIVCLGISMRGPNELKHTRANIESTREFIVNLVSYSLAEAMNVTAFDWEAGIDELQRAGLGTISSEKVRPPRIAQSPGALECVLRDVYMLGPESALIIGEVLGIHIADEAVINAERAYVDPGPLDLIGRMNSPAGYVRATDRFEMPRHRTPPPER